jgi:hypothetical protein
MADIKQAAKWMKEGFKVRRESWPVRSFCLHLGESDFSFPCIITEEDSCSNQLDCDDLLASDWEIVK